MCVIEASYLIQDIFHSNDNDSVINPDTSKLYVIEAKYLTQNILHSNDSDSVTKLDDITLCVIKDKFSTQNNFHSNDNDSVTNPDDSTSEDCTTVGRFRDHHRTTRSNSSTTLLCIGVYGQILKQLTTQVG